MRSGSRSIKVYIASPYSKGDIGENVHYAMLAWAQLWDLGYIPFCPHWTHFQHMFIPRPYEEWLEYDQAWVIACHVLLRLPGESEGADKEVELAVKEGIPVVHTVQKLMDKFPTYGESTTRQDSPA